MVVGRDEVEFRGGGTEEVEALSVVLVLGQDGDRVGDARGGGGLIPGAVFVADGHRRVDAQGRIEHAVVAPGLVDPADIEGDVELHPVAEGLLLDGGAAAEFVAAGGDVQHAHAREHLVLPV